MPSFLCPRSSSAPVKDCVNQFLNVSERFIGSSPSVCLLIRALQDYGVMWRIDLMLNMLLPNFTLNAGLD